MKPLLSVSNLTAGYTHQPVLHGASLDIEESSVFALIGPNGHGKTTLLRCLSGTINAQQGSVHFLGSDIHRTSIQERVKQGLIHVPQGDQLFGEMSVEENLLMGAYLQEGQSKVITSLEKVYAFFPKLAERRKQLANSLSGGERRMTGIGRGLMGEGRLLMIDEPSLGLAPVIIEQIYEGLKQLAQSGGTFLVVEENPSRISKIANTIALMDGGKIVWQGGVNKLDSEKQIVETYFGTS